MDTLAAIFVRVIVPVAVTVAVGYLAARLLVFDLKMLARLGLYVLVPCLTFTSMARTTLGAGEFGRIVAFTLLSVPLLWGLAARRERGHRGVFDPDEALLGHLFSPGSRRSSPNGSCQAASPSGLPGVDSWERRTRCAAERLGAARLGNILRKPLSQDIYQNPGLECSAVILQVASPTPLPAAPATRSWDKRL